MFRRSSVAVASSIALTAFSRQSAVECIFWTRAAATFGGLLICAKDLFVEATQASKPCHSTGSSTATTITSPSSSNLATSPIHARMRASLDELDEGDSPKATSLIASGDTEAACGRASCDYVFDSPEL